MAGVITASEPSWIAPFTGLSPCSFGKLLTSLRREGADAPRPGRPWSLPLEDRVLLVAAYWRTNLTLRQLAPLFGVSKSAADRIIDQLGSQLVLKQRRRFRKDAVLVADGTLVPTRDHGIAARSKNTDCEPDRPTGPLARPRPGTKETPPPGRPPGNHPCPPARKPQNPIRKSQSRTH